MIQLTKGTTTDIVVTATELVTIDSPYFLFVFKNVETKDTVSVVFSSDDDQSPFPGRYNEFSIDVDALFGDKQLGQWGYEIYEQDNAENTDPENAIGLLEVGIMELKLPAENRARAKKFKPVSNTIKIFNGE